MKRTFRANAIRSVPPGGNHPPQQRLFNISHYSHWPILPREGVPSDFFFFFTPDKLPKLRQPHASKNWIGEVNTNTLDLLHMIYFNLTTFTTVNFTTVLLLTNASYSVAIRRGGKQVKIQSQL